MAKRVTKKQAEAAVAAIREQFKSYLGNDETGPVIVWNWETPYGRIQECVVMWDDCAPYEWAMNAHQGGYDEELSSLAERAVYTPEAKNWPKGVWCEPYSSYVLCLYREN